jgi:hypothetical protein
MKNLLQILKRNALCILVLIICLTLSQSALAQDAKIQKLNDGVVPKIDGVVDALWSNFENHPISKPFYNETPTVTAGWKAAWNDTSVFILVTVIDDKHCDEWCANDYSWLSDKPEIYFDVNDFLLDGKGADTSKGHYQFSPSFQFGTDDYGVREVNWQGNLYTYHYLVTGNNYNFEYNIPISTLKNKNGNTFDPTLGKSIGFDVNISDRDAPEGKRNRAVWKNDGTPNGYTENWFNMDSAGKVLFTFLYDNPTIWVRSEDKRLIKGQTINYGDIRAGSTVRKSFTVSNMGKTALNISGISITTGGKYTLNGSSSFALASNESKEFSVDFVSATEGEFLNSIIITSNDPVNSTFNIPLVANSVQNSEGFNDAIIKKLASGAVAIDGTIEASIWDGATKHNITKPMNDEKATVSAYWKAVYNDTALFVMVSVTDDVHCDMWCSGKQEWESDKIELYLDANKIIRDGKGADTALGHYQIAPSFQNGISNYISTSSNKGLFTKYAYNITGSNYVFEYSIRLNTLLDSKNNAFSPNQLGFDVTIADNDGPTDVRRRLAWVNDGRNQENWKNMDDIGIVSLIQAQPRLVVKNETNRIDNGDNYFLGTKSKNTTNKYKFKLTNLGVSTLNITSITLSGSSAYSMTTQSASSLTSLSTRDIEVSFAPIAEGTYNGTITIGSNNGGSASNYYIYLKGNSVTGTIIEGGYVSGLWTKAGAPYYINGDITIPGRQQLIIEPGVRVKMLDHYLIQVDGGLIAKGTKTDSIYFTVNDPTGWGNFNDKRAGSWQGIWFYNNEGQVGSDSSIMDYCRINYIKSDEPNYGSIDLFNYPSFSLSNSLIDHNYATIGAGIDFWKTNQAKVTNCKFQNNFGGELLSIKNSDPKFLNCKFLSNSMDNNIISFIDNSVSSFNYCDLYSNSAGAAILNIDLSNPEMNGLNISNNIANYVYYTSNGGRPNLYNSLITNNDGIVFRSEYTDMKIVNTTIANNYSTLTGAIYCYSMAHLSFFNSIIWNNYYLTNPVQLEMDGSNSSPDFINCNIEGGQAAFTGTATFNGVYKNNMQADPAFENPTVDAGSAYNNSNYSTGWKLDITSPCLNKGTTIIEDLELPATDIAGNSRIANKFVDLGAFETYVGYRNACGNISADTTIVADTINVICNLTINDNVTLTILPGTVVNVENGNAIYTYGTIVAKGTQEEPIKFTSPDINGFWNGYSGWNGIIFDNSPNGADGNMSDNDSSVFKNCLFEYGLSTYSYGNSFYINGFNRVEIDSCQFSHNTATDYVASILVVNSKFTINHSTFSDNFLQSSYSASDGGILRADHSEVAIKNCKFYNNWSISAIYLINCNKVIIDNSMVVNNSSNLIFSENTNLKFVNSNLLNNWGAIELLNTKLQVYNSIVRQNIPVNDPISFQLSDFVSKVQVYNSVLQGSLIGNVAQLTQSNVNDIDPIFVNPSLFVGYDTTSTLDWSLQSISPCINAGMNTIASYVVPDVDFNSTKRINGNIIDIGAVENHGKLVEIVEQPHGKTLCVGESYQTIVTVSDAAYYQWQKEGVDIDGATNATFSIDKVNESDAANYLCKVRNAYGEIKTVPVALQVITAPELVSAPKSTWINDGSPLNASLVINGSKPFTYEWKKDGIALNELSNSLNIAAFSASNEGVYSCKISNKCGFVETTNIKLNVAPTLQNTTGSEICETGTFNLSVSFAGSANYLWLKDGSVIKNKTSNTLELTSIGTKDIGYYQVRVSNNEGSVVLGPVSLSLKYLPKVKYLPQTVYVDQTNKIILKADATGTEPLSYSWNMNSTAMRDRTSDELILENITKSDEAAYSCTVSNECGSVPTNQTKVVIAPQICMVSNIGTTTNKNVLIWDRNSGYDYDHFNIYRESSIRGKFDKIGTLPYASVTTFTDDVVNPKTQAFMYKITAVDKTGVETDINATAAHKTIHLLVTMGVPIGIQLDWDEYIGFEYGTYDIYRSIDNASFTKLYSMSSTSRTYTDLNAPNTKNLRYYISVSRATSCSANVLGQKAGAGPFAAAVSNMEDNSRLKFTTNILSGQVSGTNIYPNPFNSEASISYKLERQSDVNIRIIDLSGKTVQELKEYTQNPGDYTLTFGKNLLPGCYFVRISLDNKVEMQKVMKVQ